MRLTGRRESQHELTPVHAAAAAQLQRGAAQRAVQRHEQQRVDGRVHVRYVQRDLEVQLLNNTLM